MTTLLNCTPPVLRRHIESLEDADLRDILSSAITEVYCFGVASGMNYNDDGDPLVLHHSKETA